MKKILYLSLCAILIIGGFTACSDTNKNKNITEEESKIEINEAYDLYTKMLVAMAGVKSIDMDIIELHDILIDSEEPSSGSAIGNIKKSVNRETGGIDIATLFTVSVDDNTIITNAIGYYTDGIYYSETNGLKQCYKNSYEEIPFVTHADLLEFPESAVKEFTVSDHEGGKKVEMRLEGSSVISIVEKNQDAKEYNTSDVVCEFIIDKDNMLKFHRVIFEESIVDDYSKSMRIKRDISITVNSYNDVEVELPYNLDEYEYINAG